MARILPVVILHVHSFVSCCMQVCQPITTARTAKPKYMMRGDRPNACFPFDSTLHFMSTFALCTTAAIYKFSHVRGKDI